MPPCGLVSPLGEFTSFAFDQAAPKNSKHRLVDRNSICSFASIRLCLDLLFIILFISMNVNLIILKLVITSNSWPLICPTSQNHLKYQIMFYKKSPVKEFIQKTLTLRGSENWSGGLLHSVVYGICESCLTLYSSYSLYKDKIGTSGKVTVK